MADSLGGILTSGLGGNYTSMIIGPFRLKILIKVEDVGGGGVSSSFTPRLSTYDDDSKYKHDPKKLVTIMLKLGDTEIEREYTVSKNRSEMIVKVANLINQTVQSMSVNISGFKKRAVEIIAQFKPKKND